MSFVIGTHDGPFHADDVTAVALLRRFVDASAVVWRTRELGRLAECDAVVDVGGVFDAAAMRFDHHQASYTGQRSAAGLVLDWLEASGHVGAREAQALRLSAMDYLDAVDNGRQVPDPAVPCLPRLVEALNGPCTESADFDVAFEQAVALVSAWLAGWFASAARAAAALAVVQASMQAAVSAGSNVLYLGEYVPWKPPYFELGGAEHATEFAIFPGSDGSWRLVCIPPEQSSFGQKVPLPAAWAGLTDAALVAACGVEGARFCHKNRFLAVFETAEQCERALRVAGLLRGA